MAHPRKFLHADEHPETLRLLAHLFDGPESAARRRPPDGYEPAIGGAWVDWDDLLRRHVAPQDRAVLHIAHGCALLERVGGTSPGAHRALRRAILAVTPPAIWDEWFVDEADAAAKGPTTPIRSVAVLRRGSPSCLRTQDRSEWRIPRNSGDP